MAEGQYFSAPQDPLTSADCRCSVQMRLSSEFIKKRICFLNQGLMNIS